MKKKKMSWGQFRQFIPLYLMMLPGIIYLFINNYIPMTGIVVAFKDYKKSKGIWGSDWSGLKNFQFLFKGGDAAIIVRNTVLYNVVFIILGMVVGVTLAILITDVASKRAKSIYQSAIMLPFLISIVIVSYIVFAFLSNENGMLNAVLRALGKEEILWYQTPKYWPYILTFVNIWKGCGYGTLIYISGIVGIDPTFYEAARLDGATRFQQIRKITLPCLVPSIITLLIMSVGRIFASDFGLFYQVPQNSGALDSVTKTIDVYVYRALTSTGGMGKSAAAGFFQSVVGFLLVVTVNSIVRKINKENAMF